MQGLGVQPCIHKAARSFVRSIIIEPLMGGTGVNSYKGVE